MQHTIEDAWTETLEALEATGRAQRLTGGRNAQARADRAGHHALPAWVTEETAQAAVHAELLRMDPAVFAAAPSEDVRRRLFAAQAQAQARAAVQPRFAVGEDQKGQTQGWSPLEAAADMGAADPDADREEVWAAAVQVVLDAVASLPDHHRDTIERLISDRGAPSDVSPSAWANRKTRARQAFAAAHASIVG